MVRRRLGDPFEAELAEGNPAVTQPAHQAVLNRVFFNSTVDIGALVEIDGETYICTRAGWRYLRAPG